MRPYIIPLMIENLPELPYLRDKSLYLAIVMRNKQNAYHEKFALIEIPSKSIGRFVILPSSKGTNAIILLEDIVKFQKVKEYISTNQLDDETVEQAEIQVKYNGYIEKERNNADKLKRLEDVKIPENYDFDKIKSLSYEAREKFKKIRPVTVSQASRISGVSPSDISILLIYMGR